jgi:hypothetical protein
MPVCHGTKVAKLEQIEIEMAQVQEVSRHW